MEKRTNGIDEREQELLEYGSQMKLLLDFEKSDVWTKVLEPALKNKIVAYTGGFEEDGGYLTKASDKDADTCFAVAKELGALLNLVKLAGKDLNKVSVQLEQLKNRRGPNA